MPKKSSFAGLPATSFAACFAETITIPFDTAKIKLMMMKNAATGEQPTLMQAMRNVARETNVFALFRGLSAGFMRQVAFATPRVALYTPVRNGVAAVMGRDSSEVTLLDMVLAGGISGSLAISLAQPTDVIKTNIQANNYNTVREAFPGILKTYGPRGFYRGITPNVCRNMTVNMAELVTYDLTKKVLRSFDVEEGLVMHSAAAAFAGFVAATVSNPIDVIKTRMQNGEGPSIVKVARNVLAEKGFKQGFYAGYKASVVRIAGWNVIFFVTLETGLEALGLDAMAK